ncbi:autotransporter outer membrane beta-barrel domain-containing protein [Pararobbsia silviterrae]|nr:autotransporter domain-containing protein [Pararobbsia silviterrae]
MRRKIVAVVLSAAFVFDSRADDALPKLPPWPIPFIDMLHAGNLRKSGGRYFSDARDPGHSAIRVAGRDAVFDLADAELYVYFARAYALYVRDAAVADAHRIRVVTLEPSAYGMVSDAATLRADSSVVKTHGDEAIGIHVRRSGTLAFRGGTVSTIGERANGALAMKDGALDIGDVVLSDGTRERARIETRAAQTPGVLLKSDATLVAHGVDIRTIGSGSVALRLEHARASLTDTTLEAEAPGTSLVSVRNGSVLEIVDMNLDWGQRPEPAIEVDSDSTLIVTRHARLHSPVAINVLPTPQGPVGARIIISDHSTVEGDIRIDPHSYVRLELRDHGVFRGGFRTAGGAASGAGSVDAVRVRASFDVGVQARTAFEGSMRIAALNNRGVVEFNSASRVGQILVVDGAVAGRDADVEQAPVAAGAEGAAGRDASAKRDSVEPVQSADGTHASPAAASSHAGTGLTSGAASTPLDVDSVTYEPGPEANDVASNDVGSNEVEPRVSENVPPLKDVATLRLRTVINEGGALDAQRTDRVLVTGDVTGVHVIEVVPIELGAQTDRNGDGEIQPDEGISLVQVGGRATPRSFVLAGHALTGAKYQYELMAFAPGTSDRKQRLVAGDEGFWDFRLATRKAPDPSVTPPAAPVVDTTLPDDRLVDTRTSMNNAEDGSSKDAVRSEDVSPKDESPDNPATKDQPPKEVSTEALPPKNAGLDEVSTGETLLSKPDAVTINAPARIPGPADALQHDASPTIDPLEGPVPVDAQRKDSSIDPSTEEGMPTDATAKAVPSKSEGPVFDVLSADALGSAEGTKTQAGQGASEGEQARPRRDLDDGVDVRIDDTRAQTAEDGRNVGGPASGTPIHVASATAKGRSDAGETHDGAAVKDFAKDDHATAVSANNSTTNDSPASGSPASDDPASVNTPNDSSTNNSSTNGSPANEGPANDSLKNDSSANDALTHAGSTNDSPINDRPVHRSPTSDGVAEAGSTEDRPAKDDLGNADKTQPQLGSTENARADQAIESVASPATPPVRPESPHAMTYMSLPEAATNVLRSALLNWGTSVALTSRLDAAMPPAGPRGFATIFGGLARFHGDVGDAGRVYGFRTTERGVLIGLPLVEVRRAGGSTRLDVGFDIAEATVSGVSPGGGDRARVRTAGLGFQILHRHDDSLQGLYERGLVKFDTLNFDVRNARQEVASTGGAGLSMLAETGVSFALPYGVTLMPALTATYVDVRMIDTVDSDGNPCRFAAERAVAARFSVRATQTFEPGRTTLVPYVLAGVTIGGGPPMAHRIGDTQYSTSPAGSGWNAGFGISGRIGAFTLLNVDIEFNRAFGRGFSGARAGAGVQWRF